MGRNVTPAARATSGLYNAFSTAGYTALSTSGGASLAKASVSGALTANTLVDLINESGSAGYISQLSFATADATSRTLRVVITVDGTAIYDVTSAAIASTNFGACLAGTRISTDANALPPIEYASSIRVQYASSVTETGKFTAYLARTQVR